MNNKLKEALEHPLWKAHKPGDIYTMDGKPQEWKIAYYPLFEDEKTGEVHGEPRALMEKDMGGGENHFKETPLRYLEKKKQDEE